MIRTDKGIIEVSPDSTTGIVLVGGREFDCSRFVKNYKSELPTLFRDIGIWDCPRTVLMYDTVKKFNKDWAEFLGVGPSTWTKVLNYNIWKAAYEPVRQFLYLLSIQKGNIRTMDIRRLWGTKSLLEQTVDDGQENVVPLVYYLNRNTKELKDLLGKGLWKRLCKNSKTRNALVAYPASILPGYTRDYEQQIRTIIASTNNTPSTLLRRHAPRSSTDAQALLWASKLKEAIGAPYNDFYAYLNAIHLFMDTRAMAEKLAMPFNPSWSYKKLNKMHDLYSRKILSLEYSKEEFDYYSIKIEKGDLRAQLLMSPYEVAIEGAEMRHCVAHYADLCQRKKYAVASIAKNGKRYSTLGLAYVRNKGLVDTPSTAAPKGKWVVSQHMRHANVPVVDPEVKQLASDFAVKMQMFNPLD